MKNPLAINDNFEKKIAYANGEMELISLFSKRQFKLAHLFLNSF